MDHHAPDPRLGHQDVDLGAEVAQVGVGPAQEALPERAPRSRQLRRRRLD
ncbi:hypothetical protein [Candidatus Nephthysia bennettiae]